jgi:hypothetical protein
LIGADFAHIPVEDFKESPRLLTGCFASQNELGELDANVHKHHQQQEHDTSGQSIRWSRQLTPAPSRGFVATSIGSEHRANARQLQGLHFKRHRLRRFSSARCFCDWGPRLRQIAWSFDLVLRFIIPRIKCPISGFYVSFHGGPSYPDSSSSELFTM